MRKHRPKQIIVIGLLICSSFASTLLAEDTKRIHSKGNNEFAFTFYHLIDGEKGNIFYSPYSLRTALAMTYAGAKNETAEEIRSTLNFDLEGYDLHSTFLSTANDIESNEDSGYELNIANSLWGQRNNNWLDEFLTVTKRYYGAGLREVDFRSNESAEEARNEINSWVKNSTNRKIMHLIPPNELNPKIIPGNPPRIDVVQMVLANAIYFKGDWGVHFPEEATVEDDFFSGKDVFKTPLMHRLGGGFRYGESDGSQILEIPYKDDRLSMIVILPSQKIGLQGLEKSLSQKQFAKWNSKLRNYEKVDVFLPKFKITWSGEMSDWLKDAGMETAFKQNADFSGMIDPRLQQTPLYIGAIFQKAFVEVNEKGTEAAAATAILINGVITTSVKIPQPVPVFRADHPFMFFIIEKVNGNILFMGRMERPL
ncbi:MAG: serpin family protein [Candidatus Marinimicrobia bacterium]|nr:serpin family protein [Candidatus Neomarinimicrobiota bacterium]